MDDDVYEWASEYKWYAYTSNGPYYAMGSSGKCHNKRLHRLILNAAPDEICDHINGDGLDNRRCNLRIATHAENCQNARKQKRTDSPRQQSKFIGVHAHREKWVARIAQEQNRYYLGSYTDEVDAALAYDDAARKLYGQHARVNFP